MNGNITLMGSFGDLNCESLFQSPLAFDTRNRTKGPSSSILMPNDIHDADSDVDTNLFDFYPDPAHFVDFLKTIERGDIVSDIFIQILESYRSLKSDANEDSMRCTRSHFLINAEVTFLIRTLHKLQIIIQMQKRLLSEDTASNILHNPDHILSFILHVLESATIPARSDADDGFGNKRFQSEIDEDEDSDDEMQGSEVVGPDDEMIETAISLLLAILEGNQLWHLSVHGLAQEEIIFSQR